MEYLEDRTVPSLFAPPIMSPANLVAAQVVGDFNSDGHLDVAGPGTTTGVVSLMLGDGGGGFTPGPSFQASTEAITALATGDFNGDGHLDLAVLSQAFVTNHFVSYLSVFLGDGHGGFTQAPGSPLTVNGSLGGLTVADVNGDGHPDLIAGAGNGTQYSVEVFLGDGKGGFAAPISSSLDGADTSQLAVADVNSDGHPDLIAMNPAQDTIEVFLGDGTGGFGAPTSFPAGPPPSTGSNQSGPSLDALVVGDFNGDGHPDVAVGSQTAFLSGIIPINYTITYTSTVSVLLGDGKGGFGAPLSSTLPDELLGPPAVVGDFYGDGHLDLAMLGSTAPPYYGPPGGNPPGTQANLGFISVFRGDGTGHFAGGANVNLPGGAEGFGLVAADFNGDGRPDLLTTTGSTSTTPVVSVFLSEPADLNEVYVAQLYQNLLGRPADPGGRAHWVGLLESGAATRAGVARLIEASPEYQQVEIQGLYQHYLHRAANPTELQVWAQAMRQGLTVEQVAAYLIGSPEYYQLHGATFGGFATAVYLDVLGRYPSATEAANVEQALAAGFNTTQVAAFLLSTPEYQQRVVGAYYLVYLARPADPTGLASYGSELQHGLRDEDVLAQILGSQEYLNDL